MIKFGNGSIASVVVALTLVTAASGWCAGVPPEETLKSHGLKRAGDLFVLESETPVKNKVREIRQLSRLLSHALERQQGTVTAGEYQQTIKSLSDQINQYKTELNTVNQQIKSFPRYRGRLLSTYATQEYQELSVYKSQLQAELNQEAQYLTQIKNQPIDPRAREKVDAEVKERGETIRQATADLRKLVNATQEKYAELAKNDDVTSALQKLAIGSRTKPKLGPSHEFSTDVKVLEKLESEEANGTDPASQPRHGRTTRRSVKGKRSPRPAAGVPTPAPAPASAPTTSADESP